jgi:hypothetical protein
MSNMTVRRAVAIGGQVIRVVFSEEPRLGDRGGVPAPILPEWTVDSVGGKTVKDIHADTIMALALFAAGAAFALILH